MEIKINKNTYKVIKNHKEAFNQEELLTYWTDYFEHFDYILGDYAYNKLRLKGFNNKNNKNFKEYNDYDKIDSYIKKYCAYGCKYFILEKI